MPISGGRDTNKARELRSQSIKVSKSHDNEELIQFIDLYSIGLLVQHVTLFPDIPVNPDYSCLKESPRRS